MHKLAMVLAAAACLLFSGGCGGGVKTYPVAGKVEVKDGDVAPLAGSNIEFVRTDDELIRASGRISPGGEFTVTTLHDGKVLEGAPQGEYKGRIVLGDESDEDVPKRQGDPVHRRYYDFQTSGLKLTVPPDGEVVVSLSRR
jgi:hypothetical protein